MDNNYASVYLSGLIDDLNDKISALDFVASNANENVKGKAMLIRDKAVSVLNNVIEKISELSETVSDGEELESTIEMINKKAENLFNEAVNKINRLVPDETGSEDEQTQDDIVELVKDDKEEFGVYGLQDSKAAKADDVPEEDRRVKAEPVRSEVSEKALKVLKNWLKPDEVHE